MRNNHEEIYNGQKLQGPINLESLAGSSEDEAFAEGRRLYKTGRSLGYLKNLGKNRPKTWHAALRKGWFWQESRS